MNKYSYIELQIKNGQLLGLSNLSNLQYKALTFNNVIYLYKNIKSNKVYIGQTINFIKRHKQHFSGKEDKFNNVKFNRVIILFSQYFGRSALDDVENQLINYFVADNSKNNRQLIQFDDEVTNLTEGNTVAEYKDREKVSSEVILPFWKEVLYPKNWVNSKTVEILKSAELFKYSPIKELTNQQEEFINQIIKNDDMNYVINGDAGTGKTVLLTHLVAKLLKNNKRIKVAVVVQPNWEKIAKRIFNVYGINNDYLTIATSTKIINEQEHYDVIIVDEAHKLSRRFGKQHPSFNSVYKIPRFKHCQSHLEILKLLGKQMVLMYDVLQTIRPANITREEFRELTSNFKKEYLTTQFRIQAPKNKSYTSDDYINGIKYLLYKDTGLLEYTSFNPNFDRSVFQDKSSDAYFGYVEHDPLHNLFNWINEDSNVHHNHINRVLGGLVEPWKQADGKDINKKQWHEGDLHLRWNSAQENWINSKDSDAEEQIGSVFAVQGIDLNKVGVLIGNDLQVDNQGKLFANRENFHNVNGTFKKEEADLPENKYEFKIFVLNIYYVLMTRGIDGIRLGFWHNNAFKKYMQKTLNCQNTII